MSFLNDLTTVGANPNVRVMNLLHTGALRFAELLCNDTPLAERTLSDGLKELDRAGLVVRRVDPGPPLRVLYALTPIGARLAPTLQALATWLEAKIDNERRAATS